MNRDHYLGGAAVACICMLIAGIMWAIQPKQSPRNPNVNNLQTRAIRTIPMDNSSSPRYIVDPKAVADYTNQANMITPERIRALREGKTKPRIRTIYTMPQTSQPGPPQTMPLESQRAPE